MKRTGIAAIVVTLALAVGLALAARSARFDRSAEGTSPDSTHATRMKAAPEGRGEGTSAPAPTAERFVAEGPFVSELGAGQRSPAPTGDMPTRGGGRPESRASQAKAEALRAEARRLPPSARVQRLESRDTTDLVQLDSFISIDADDCCAGAFTTVPPDPELAAGPDHVIAVDNIAFAIHSKSTGAIVSGPLTFGTFFAGIPECTDDTVFDPNVVYDEIEDRWVIGIDDDGTHYCVAASDDSNPIGTWYLYRFSTNFSNAFFDYPHIGVGTDAIYMGSNQFDGTLPGGFEGRVFAMDKAAMYAGTPMTVVSKSLTSDWGTPQPMHVHGRYENAYPDAGHHILSDFFDGCTIRLWEWFDPFGANNLVGKGTRDLCAATGVQGGFPLDWPQAGSATDLQANDWRLRSAEWRNGRLWTTDSISCNPGGGAVNCVRWAELDPEANAIVDAGVFSSNAVHRTFPRLSVDACGNMMVGYSHGSSSTFGSSYVAGREYDDAPGTVKDEQVLKAGEQAYSSFPSDPSPHRWGDYLGTAIDPAGTTFWHLGEYATSNVTVAASDWGTYIGSYGFSACAPSSADGFDDGTLNGWDSIVP